MRLDILSDKTIISIMMIYYSHEMLIALMFAIVILYAQFNMLGNKK